MTNKEIVKLIQGHKALEPFNYKIAVDWAIDLIQKGKETENILILASFSEPIEKYEIAPYVTAVLDELGLEELEVDDAIIAQTHLLLLRILKDEDIRKNLHSLSQVCVNNDFDNRVMDFYLLFHAWDEMEEIGANYYYNGADLDNIETVIKLETKIWIDKYIYKKENNRLKQELQIEKDKSNAKLYCTNANNRTSFKQKPKRQNSRDLKYQSTVNNAAKKLYSMTIDELKDLPDWGVVDDNSKHNIAYSKWEKEKGIIHIHLMIERLVFPFPRLYKKYHAGIAIENNIIRFLTNEELGDYD